MDRLSAYNLMILINFVLAGFAMYQLMRYLTGSVVAALLAGIVFAFNSHNVYQSAHPDLLSVWILPLYTLVLIRGFREDSLIWPLLTALMLFLAGAASTLILVVLGLWTAPLILYLMLAEKPKLMGMRNTVVALGLGVLLVLPLILPLLKEALLGSNTSFLNDSSTTIPSDMFAPLVPPWYVWMRKSIYFGIVATYFTIVAIARARRQAVLWILLLVGAYLFSIGPNPIFLGRALPVELPWSYVIPPLLRQTHRLNILVSFGLAAMVAYGWCAASELISRKYLAPLIAFVAVLLMLTDYLAWPMPATDADVPPFYAQCLADRPEELNLAIVPSGRNIDKLHMYYQTFHGMKMTGGHISRHTGEELAYLESNALLRAGRRENWQMEPPINGPVHLQDLADNGIDLLILEKAFLDIDQWQAAVPVVPTYEDADVLVFDVGRLAGEEWLNGKLCPGQG
jgi:hypothetical protein